MFVYYESMSEYSEQYPSLLQDEPIRSVAADRYGRSEYVRNLALGLSRFPGPGSLVVGIEGSWGSGKTSLKNMLVEQLAEIPPDKEKEKNIGEKKLRVVEFEPWVYSGSGRLMTLLFNQISRSLLGKLGVAKHAVAKTLKHVTGVEAPISDVAPTLGQLIQGFGDLGEALEPDSQDIKKLSERRDDLKWELNKSATRIIVFIDDLDRLMDDEVTDVMRAVKAVGDLPYMTYVLLYDKDSVTRSLDACCHGKGNEYLEKIVQVPIGLPEPVKEVVLDRLKQELRNIIDDQDVARTSSGSSASPSRLQAIYESCVAPFVNNMRDVNRLINEFNLRYQVLKDDVEFGDLLGITSLEVFNPDLHRWIRTSKNHLCNSEYREQANYNLYNSMIRDKGLKKYLESMPSSNPVAEARDLKAVKSLFPRVSYVVDKVDPVDGMKDQRFSTFWGYRSIFKVEHFNAYFRLVIDNGLFHEDVYKRLLIDDPLNKESLDHEHWEIVSDEYFPSRVEKYAKSLSAERCAKIMRYCLNLEAQLYSSFLIDYCVSLRVAVALMHAKNSADTWVETILKAIEDSDSPVSMWVAAFFAVEIHNELVSRDHLEANGSIESYLVDDLTRFISSNVTIGYGFFDAEEWNNNLKLLCNKLKRQDFELPKDLLFGSVIEAYADVIPIIFDNDDDRCTAFNAFHCLVCDDLFVDYVFEALTQEHDSGSGYITVSPSLKRAVTSELCQSFIDSWKTGVGIGSSDGVNRVAAYELALGSGDLDEPVDVPMEQVNALVDSWRTGKTE